MKYLAFALALTAISCGDNVPCGRAPDGLYEGANDVSYTFRNGLPIELAGYCGTPTDECTEIYTCDLGNFTETVVVERVTNTEISLTYNPGATVILRKVK